MSNKIINFLIKLLQNNEYEKTINLCKENLQIYDNSIDILKILGLAYIRTKKYELATNTFLHLLKLQNNDHEIFNNLGFCYKNQSLYEDAIINFKKAIKLNPLYIEAINNLAISQFKLGYTDESKSNFLLAIKLDPNHIDAYINLGSIYYNLGEFELSESILNKGLAIDSNSFIILNFLGLINQELFNFEKSIEYYWKSFLLNTQNSIPINNLISLLSSYNPINNKNIITLANSRIRNIPNPYSSSGINDKSIVKFYENSIQALKSMNLELKTNSYEIYRRNSLDLNCSRHMTIFKEKNIIPNFCFGCFKIQIEPSNVIDLIKLFLFFDSLELSNNNQKKCFVEIRPNIEGFYKGLIYCSSFEEAKLILDEIKNPCISILNKDLKFSIKRGCSEYGLSFENYKNTDINDERFMNYEESWNDVEKNFDKINFIRQKKIKSTLKGPSLSDILIIQKWLDYAKGIRDPKMILFKNDNVIYEKLFITAQKRVT